MSSFQRYGDPATGQVPVRPSCWGSQYNSESRECRQCGWNTTCREYIVQLNINRQNQAPQTAAPVASPAPAFPLAPYTAPTPVAAPAWPPAPAPAPPAAPAVFRPPTPPAPAPTVTPVGPQHQPSGYQLPPHIPAVMPGGYGTIQDPMFNYLGAIPAPIRPQYQGESFAQRVFKNAALGGVEGILHQITLGVRQYRWYPDPPAPVPTTLNVTPIKKD